MWRKQRLRWAFPNRRWSVTGAPPRPGWPSKFVPQNIESRKFTMDSARWEQIQAIFHQALELPESDRSPFLKTACGEDAELAGEVDAMLRADGRETSLLDRGLHRVAHGVLGSPTAAIPHQEFGPYRLLRVLGEGGMGVVWLAQRQDAGNLVAIKFLPHAALSPARRERFTHEIKTLGKLKQ